MTDIDLAVGLRQIAFQRRMGFGALVALPRVSLVVEERWRVDAG